MVWWVLRALFLLHLSRGLFPNQAEIDFGDVVRLRRCPNPTGQSCLVGKRCAACVDVPIRPAGIELSLARVDVPIQPAVYVFFFFLPGYGIPGT